MTTVSRSGSRVGRSRSRSESSDSVALPANPVEDRKEEVSPKPKALQHEGNGVNLSEDGAEKAAPSSDEKVTLYISFGQEKNTREISARALQEYMQNILYRLNGKTEEDAAQDAAYAEEQAAAKAAAEAEAKEKEEGGETEKTAPPPRGEEEAGAPRERRPRRFPPIQKRTSGVLSVRMSFRCAFAEISTRREAQQIVDECNGKTFQDEYTLSVEFSLPKVRRERKERAPARRDGSQGRHGRPGERRRSRSPIRGGGERYSDNVVMFIGLGPNAGSLRDGELIRELERYVPIRACRRGDRCAFVEVDSYNDGDYLIRKANNMRLGDVRVAVQYSRQALGRRPGGGVRRRSRSRSRSGSKDRYRSARGGRRDGPKPRSRSRSHSRSRSPHRGGERRRTRRSYTPSSRSRSYSSRSRSGDRRRR